MLGYLSKQLPEVELKVTGFDYQALWMKGCGRL